MNLRMYERNLRNLLTNFIIKLPPYKFALSASGVLEQKESKF